MLLSMVAIWGLNFSIMKYLYAYFNPLAFTGPRFCVAVVTLAAILKLRGDPLTVDRQDLPSIMGLGIVSTTIYQILFVFGLANTKAGNVGLVMAATPIFAYLTGVISKRESFSNRVLSGIALSVAGVAVIVLSGSKSVSFGADWRGTTPQRGLRHQGSTVKENFLSRPLQFFGSFPALVSGRTNSSPKRFSHVSGICARGCRALLR